MRDKLLAQDLTEQLDYLREKAGLESTDLIEVGYATDSNTLEDLDDLRELFQCVSTRCFRVNRHIQEASPVKDASEGEAYSNTCTWEFRGRKFTLWIKKYRPHRDLWRLQAP